MLTFKESHKQWGTKQFSKTLKKELESLDKGVLPLEFATTQGGLVDDSNISALINQCSETDTNIQIKVGIFFDEVVAGCNCDDDPVADNTYCELLVNIDKISAATVFKLLQQ